MFGLFLSPDRELGVTRSSGIDRGVSMLALLAFFVGIVALAVTGLTMIERTSEVPTPEEQIAAPQWDDAGGLGLE